MPPEKYMFDIGAEGSKGLGKLDYLFNPTTQEFLLRSGLKPNMTILDIGCGSGAITCWMAEQVGVNGLVIGIENDINQLNAAKKRAHELMINNIRFELCSAYDIKKLNMQFDLVYCRFVLHHLHDPVNVITNICQVLKPEGIYAAEEGIVNFSFSYPFSEAWGDECLRLPPPWTDSPSDNRDPNIGIKMFTKMRRAGFNILNTKIIHPLMITQDQKKLLLLGIDETKNFYLSSGHTEDDWHTYIKKTEVIVNNDEQIVGFYASCQVAGRKESSS